MAREKHKVSVAEDLNFDIDTVEETDLKESMGHVTEIRTNIKEAQNTPLDPDRTYSKYYAPHPKLGAKGGVIGKPPVKEKERKRSVSIQLSDTQKERFSQAAAKDSRKWPDFVVKAIEEYIENHNL